VFLFVRIAAGILLFGIAVAGIVISMRGASIAWRPVIRTTAVIAVPALAAEALRLSLAGRGYDTSIAWETFLTRQVLSMLQSFAFEIFVVFLCVLVLLARGKETSGLLAPEGRARYGRDAVRRALASVAAMFAVVEIGRALRAASRVGIDVGAPVNELFAIPVPAVDVAWRGIFIALWLTSLAGGYVSFAGSLPPARRRLAHASAALCLALVAFDSAARPSDMGWAALEALVTGAGVFVVVRFLLADNPLAALLAALPWAAADDLTLWIRSGRVDLAVNGIVLAVIIAGVFAWCWTAGRRKVKAETLG